MGLPQGTVTFLFTDLEGSTRRWEAHPEQMKDALARHDAMVRSGLRRLHAMIARSLTWLSGANALVRRAGG